MKQYPSELQRDDSLDAESRSLEPRSSATALELPYDSKFPVLDDAQTEVVLLAQSDVAKLLGTGASPSTMDASEPLSPVQLAKLLFQCWSRQATGALLVTRETETLTVFIEAGALVLIESSIPGDVLGRTLVQNGRIEAEQYAQSAQHAIETGVSLGRALVELEHLSREDLTYESAAIAREQIVSCFTDQAGTIELQADRIAPESDRRCMIPMGIVLAEGVSKHFDAAMRTSIVPDFERRYFRLQREAQELIGDYALGAAQQRFLAFAGRAYNVTDAGEAARLSAAEAHALLALLTICEEITDFTPGVAEFEARISEERARQLELSRVAAAAAVVAVAPAPIPLRQPATDTNVIHVLPSTTEERPAFHGEEDRVTALSAQVESMPSDSMLEPADEADEADETENEDKPLDTDGSAAALTEMPRNASKAALPSESRVTPPPSLPENGVPPMPVANDPAARTPEWIQFGPPLESTRSASELHEQSREHFQRGVALLTLGNFDAAEIAFREAIALRAEPQVSAVYLVALGRAIYYNPSYTREGKLPLLVAIVHRTKQLAPNDPRVLMLANWVRHAEVGTA